MLLTLGYWNIKLSGQSSLLTILNTQFGQFKFEQLPFGLVSSGEYFQQRVDSLFKGISGTFPVADDIKVQGATELEHDIDILENCDHEKQVGLVFYPTSAQSNRMKLNTIIAL